MTISIMALICWLIVGVLNIVDCTSHRKCSWLNYWLLYGVLIINLIDEVFEKLI